MKIFAKIKNNLHITSPPKDELKTEKLYCKNFHLRDYSKVKMLRKIAFVGSQINSHVSIIKNK